jgi:hypothetical protein
MSYGSSLLWKAPPLYQEGADTPGARLLVCLRQYDRPVGDLGAGDPGLLTLEDVGTTFAPGHGLYGRSVGSSLRLGQRESAHGLSRQQRSYHGFLLLGAVLVQDERDEVRAAHDIRDRGRGGGERLDPDRPLQRGLPRALGTGEAEKTFLSHPAVDVGGERVLPVYAVGARHHLLSDEAAHAPHQLCMLRFRIFVTPYRHRTSLNATAPLPPLRLPSRAGRTLRAPPSST